MTELDRDLTGSDWTFAELGEAYRAGAHRPGRRPSGRPPRNRPPRQRPARNRPPRSPRAQRGPVARAALVLGELLITFGLIVFLFIFYELVVTNWKTAATQHRLVNQLQQQWKQPVANTPTTAPTKNPAAAIPTDPALDVADGQPYAVVRIPRFGASYKWVIVEGVDESDLQEGPGHYPGTAEPGQIGNFVVSGHRTTYGAPFNRLGELRPGDLITIQTRYRTWTYQVRGTTIVDPTATYVILPVPGKFGVAPTQRLMTFTTCNPEYSAAQRMVVTSELVGHT